MCYHDKKSYWHVLKAVLWVHDWLLHAILTLTTFKTPNLYHNSAQNPMFTLCGTEIFGTSKKYCLLLIH